MCESTSVPAKAFSQCLQLPSVTNSTEFATLLLEPRPPHWHPPFGITCATALFTLVGPFQFWPTFPLFRFPKIVRFSRFSDNISTPSTSSLRYFLEILSFSKAIFFLFKTLWEVPEPVFPYSPSRWRIRRRRWNQNTTSTWNKEMETLPWLAQSHSRREKRQQDTARSGGGFTYWFWSLAHCLSLFLCK